MSKYTTEVRYICETNVPPGTIGVDSFRPRDFIYYSKDNIFNFNWPIFDENYRDVLETKILTHFYTREICEETVELWKLRLEDKLNIIMPYYNQLYKSELLEFNPFYDVDLSKTSKETRNADEGVELNESITRSDERGMAEHISSTGENKSTTKTEGTNHLENSGRDTTHTSGSQDDNRNSSGWNLFSDTPQGGINGIEGDGNGNGVVGDNFYLTNATKTSNNETAHSENEGDSSTDYGKKEDGNTTGKVKGKTNISNVEDRSVNEKGNSEEHRGNKSNKKIENLIEYGDRVIGKTAGSSYSRLLQEFRNTFMNIDAMILEELEPLFFGLW